MLPNKVVSYSKSSFPQFVILKKALLQGPENIAILWERCEESFGDIAEFIEVLECLYALREIEVVGSEVLLHAEKN